MYNAEKPTFNVTEPFLGVTNVQLNRAMVDQLILILQDQQGAMLPKEIWAFVRALNDPAGCREMRAQRKRITRPLRQAYDSYQNEEYFDDSFEEPSEDLPK
jgi:hypothetical protein